MNFSIRFTAALSTLAVIGGLALRNHQSWAAPPDNDDRADAIRVDPPQTVGRVDRRHGRTRHR